MSIGCSSKLDMALSRGDIATAKQLLNEGHETSKNTLCCASSAGDIEIVKKLINEGANVNYSSITSGPAPLLGACEKGHFEIVKYLIQKGAHINPPLETSTKKSSPFHAAARGGHIKIIHYLIEKGADIHYRDSYGYNAIYRAVGGGGTTTNQLALTSSSTTYGSTYTHTKRSYNVANPEFIQAVERYQETIRLLKKLGVTLEQKSYSGNTTLLNFDKYAFAWRRYNPDFRNELRE